MYEVIDRKELEKKLAKDKEVKVIEVLEKEEYERNHLKDAINIPLASLGREVKERFDRDQELVVYCADIDCQASTKAAQKLDKLGFENVYDYEEGKKDWREAGNPMVSGS